MAVFVFEKAEKFDSNAQVGARVEASGYANLEEGQRVQFEVGQGKKGPCATNVVPG